MISVPLLKLKEKFKNRIMTENQSFSMKAPEPVYTQREEDLIPVGQHVAILVRIIDLGNQWVENKNGKKYVRKLQLVFELPLQLRVFTEGEEAKPAWIYANFTFVVSNNSHLKKFLDTALKRTLNQSEYNTVDIGSLLGKEFNISVTNTVQDNGRIWQNVGSAVLIDERERAQMNIEWEKIIPKNGVYGFIVDDEGECFKSLLFGDFTDNMRKKLLNSEQGQAFIASGGVPYTKNPNPPRNTQPVGNDSSIAPQQIEEQPKGGDIPAPVKF